MRKRSAKCVFFLKKSTQFWLPRFGVLLSTHDFVPIFFLFFSPLFSGGTWVLLWSWCPELHETRGGARVAFFFSANAGGNALRATYLRQTRGGKGFFCPFFGGVFGSSVPFLFFSRGGLPKRKQQKQQEQRNLDQKKQRNKDEKKRKKEEEEEEEEEKEEEKEEDEEDDEEEEEKGQDKKEKKEKEKNKKDKSKKKKEGQKGKHGRKENREKKKGKKGKKEQEKEKKKEK